MEDLQVPQLHLKETISDLRSDFRLCPFSDRAIKTSQTAELFQAVTFIPLELSYTFMSALFSVTFHFVHFDPHTRFRMAPPALLFEPVWFDQVEELCIGIKTSSCPNEVVPIHFLKRIFKVVSCDILAICNSSLKSGVV